MANQSRYSEAVDVSPESVQIAEDEIDAAIAQKRLSEIERNPEEIIRGKALEEELADILVD